MNVKLHGFVCNEYRKLLVQRTRNYAGHSKWQNIKAIKMQTDKAKSDLFSNLSAKMKLTVTETGDANPDSNSRLAGLIELAKKNNMPSSTINNILERLRNTKQNCPLNSILIRSNTGVILIVYFQNENLILVKNILAQISKKFQSKVVDNTVLNSFECASYIKAFKDCNMDQAMEDAIQTDADDVEQIERDDETYFQFKSKYLHPERTLTQLTNLGYTIGSVDNICTPITEIALNEAELANINKLKKRITTDIQGIVKIEDNIAS